MAEVKTFELDPSLNAPYLIFANGDIARMVKTFIEEDDYIRFFLVPTESMNVRLGIKGNEHKDKFYDKVEDIFERRIPKKWLKLLNPHPLFQRWLAYCDWNLDFIEPSQSKIRELSIENARLKKERDSFAEKVKALTRKISRMSRHEGTQYQESLKFLSKAVKEFNILAPPDSKKRDEGGM